MNQVILIGRLTKDPEFRYGANQTAVAKFTVAVDRAGKEKAADFISCTAFGKTAELIDRYMSKGRQIAVQGRIQTGKYEKDGRTVYTTDVIVERMEFVGSKDSNASPSIAPSFDDNPVPEGFSNLEDDIPF